MAEFYEDGGTVMVKIRADEFNEIVRQATDEDRERFRDDWTRCMAPPKKAKAKK